MNKKTLHIFDSSGELKKCSVKDHWVPIDQFYRSNGQWDGLQPKCKKCDNENRTIKRRETSPQLSFNKWLSDKQNKNNKTIGMFLLRSDKKIINDINIWEHEWINKRKQVENFLVSALGLGTSVGARNCDFKTVPLYEAKSFCEQNHIQGYSHITNLAIGGYYNNELVVLATFSPHHRNGKEITLNRFCGKYGFHVSGALSKVSKMAIEHFKQPIFTWVHKTLSNGRSYVKSGWEIIDELKPDYFYINKENHVISKQSRQKRVVGTTSDMTEWQHAELDGLTKVYDLGKIKLKFS